MVTIKVEHYTGMSVVEAEVVAKVPTLAEIRKALGPLSMLFTAKTLKGFVGDGRPFDLVDSKTGVLKYRISVVKIEL